MQTPGKMHIRLLHASVYLCLCIYLKIYTIGTYFNSLLRMPMQKECGTSSFNMLITGECLC